MSLSTDSADPFGPLRARFLARCREELALVERAIAEPDMGPGPLLRAAVHRLAGAAGTFGFPAVSDRAGRVDDVLHDGNAPRLADLEALAEALRAVLR
jgi:HPt (histidine-containing phosphotransfer) domain-containing protein